MKSQLSTRLLSKRSGALLNSSTKPPRTLNKLPARYGSSMTTANFKYIDPATFDPRATEPFKKAWSKVDGPGQSFSYVNIQKNVENIREKLSEYGTDVSGFAVYHSPAKEKDFVDDKAIREGYYSEVEALVREKLPGVKKVIIFDHTIRRKQKASPRQPVQQVHVDQTPGAAETRVRRHASPEEVEDLLKGRHQIINVWRPISNPATDFPLAVIDWRSTSPSDFVKTDLLYPKRDVSQSNGTAKNDDDDDRGKEKLADANSIDSTEGYEVKGETYMVQSNEGHRWCYIKDMTPDEAMFIKCFDSRSQALTNGKTKIADSAPHTAFIDPQTPEDAPGRQSIEVRCLVFYD